MRESWRPRPHVLRLLAGWVLPPSEYDDPENPIRDELSEITCEAGEPTAEAQLHAGEASADLPVQATCQWNIPVRVLRPGAR